MYLTLKQQVKHLSKKEFRNLKHLSHIAKNLTNEAIYNIRQYYFNKGEDVNSVLQFLAETYDLSLKKENNTTIFIK